jgi:hypothetical protein
LVSHNDVISFSSHDGELVISGSEDHYVYMWRAQHRIASARKDKNDFYESFSGETSENHHYCRPTITDKNIVYDRLKSLCREICHI